MVRYRRFESLSVHALLQGFSMLECEWLRPASASAARQRTTTADVKKRHELLSEFMVWLFDSFVVDLIRVSAILLDPGHWLITAECTADGVLRDRFRDASEPPALLSPGRLEQAMRASAQAARRVRVRKGPACKLPDLMQAADSRTDWL